jgi:hypothetical protein
LAAAVRHPLEERPLEPGGDVVGGGQVAEAVDDPTQLGGLDAVGGGRSAT